jgi:deoxyribose-phosphate aldolase
MHIEYCCYDYAITEAETTLVVESAIKHGVKNIFVLPYSINYIKSEMSSINDEIKFGCPADFPYGLSDQKTRNYIVENLAKSKKISYIDLFIPTKIITNRKYEKLREDIRSNLEICVSNNVELRYVLEYRKYGHEVLAKICQILKSFNIDKVLPSSGAMIDDIADNIIACKFLNTKTNIDTICTGNIYTSNHIDLLYKANIFGFRINNTFALQLVTAKKGTI